MAKAAINGMGRIGRATLKVALDSPDIDIVAINDLVPVESVVYMLKYDTVYGRYEKTVMAEGDSLIIGGKRIRYVSERDPSKLTWGELGVDIVFECTGVFTKKEDLEKHIKAGAKHAILSAPSKSPELATVVHGVNESADQVISCASCTTNCITPVVEIIGRRFGIKKAMMTTVHAYTASQALVDSANAKFRRGRAGAANFVPTSTGAAKATTKALPQYEGRFDGVAVRAPVPVGSISDIVFLLEKKTTKEEVNRVLKEESESARYREVVGVSEDPIVSSDIIKDSRASIIDLGMTQVVDGDMLKIMSWYDNEWGYSCQMVREGARLARESALIKKKAA